MAGTTILAVGAAQGVFLTLALLFKKTANPNATRALAAVVGVFTVLAFGQLLQELLSSARLDWMAFVFINVELTLGPLFLLFVRYLFDPDRRWRMGDTVQFLPFVVGVVGWLALYFVQAGTAAEPNVAAHPTLVTAYLGFKAVFFYAYLARVLATLRRGVARTRRVVAGRQSVELGWLVRWFWGFIGAATVLYGLCFVNAFAPGIALPTDDLANLTLVLMLYLVALMALLRPWVLSARPRRSHTERHTADVALVERWLDQERTYLDPDLTLRGLADALGFSENRLSTVLNEGLGTTFYDLVSRYRLSHFERLAADRDLRERTVLDLAFESGFNSKASFYRYFKSSHPVTPSAFRKHQLG